MLHHIANVSTVVREIGRALKPGGLFVFREPIHSMGDWRGPRHGLTRNERGIPPGLMKRHLQSAGLQPICWKFCMFGPFSKLNELRVLPECLEQALADACGRDPVFMFQLEPHLPSDKFCDENGAALRVRNRRAEVTSWPAARR